MQLHRQQGRQVHRGQILCWDDAFQVPRPDSRTSLIIEPELYFARVGVRFFFVAGFASLLHAHWENIGILTTPVRLNAALLEVHRLPMWHRHFWP